MRTRGMVYTGAAAVGAAGILLAACGGGGSTATKAAPAAATSPSTSAPTTTAPSTPTVMTKTDPKLGTILADGQGLTLYTLTSNGKAVACTGGCTSVWPPLTLPTGAASPTAGSGVSGLGVAAGPDGGQLVTAGGLPLYRFAQDKDSGDAYGEGIQSFGGIWHVVKAGATSAPAAASPAPAATTPRTTTAYRAPMTTKPSSGSGGMGY